MTRFTVTIILSLLVLALLIVGGWWLLNYQTPSQPAVDDWLDYTNQELGLTFSYPAEYEAVEEGSPLTLQAKYPTQAQLGGLWPVTIRLVDYPTATSTFADYTGNLKENLILDLAWAAHQSEVDDINTKVSQEVITKEVANQQLVALEQTINEEILGYKDRYTFKDEVINGLNALIHSRSVYVNSRPILEVYIDWNGKVLVFSSEADNTLLDRLYHSVRKI